MKRVLVAGATGYLGGHLARELKSRGYWVRALVRRKEQGEKLSAFVDELFVGEVTKPETLKGICRDMNLVFSTIGITRQKDNLTYEDVDYQGNMNLLHEARISKVKTFLYVSVFNAQKVINLKIIQAKERFVRALVASDIGHCIIRPTGFFSDMKEMLNLAKKGKAMVFGNGEIKGNPISGRDLAKVCCDSVEAGKQEVGVGGPKVYTQNEIVQAAFDALGKKPRVTRIPTWIVPLTLPLLRLFTSSKFYGPIEFFMTALTISFVADRYGEDLLETFYQEEARNM